MSLSPNSQSRKWQIVINNPLSVGLTRERIKEELFKLTFDYACMSDEIASTGTPHTHIYIQSEAPIRFSTLKTRFPIAHLDKAYGSAQANRDYIAKIGKWEGTDKAKTSIKGSFEEFGSCPTPKQEKFPAMTRLLTDICDGKSSTEIIKENPNFGFKVKDIELLREKFLCEKYQTENRQIKVIYQFGASGTGKTRGVFKKHGAANICRITSYRKGTGVLFDAYHGQEVLVFEEFTGQVPIRDMLNYLDIYPLMLPARYNDRIACYTTVYLNSNTSFGDLYPKIQKEQPETWKAFCRRITKIIEYLPNGETKHHNKEEYIHENLHD